MQAASPTARIYRRALVRRSNKIEKITYYCLDSRAYVDSGGNDVSIVEAITGRWRTSTDYKEEFVQNDPELIKVGYCWTCGGCRRPAYRAPICYDTLRSWMTHKLKCRFVQKKLRYELSGSTAPVQRAAAKPNTRRTSFKEDIKGIIRQISSEDDDKTEGARIRRAVLQNSVLAGAVEPRRVFCLGCDEWIHLSSRAYNAYNWDLHLEAHVGWGLRQDPDSRDGGRQRSTSPIMRSKPYASVQPQKTSKRAVKSKEGKVAGGSISSSNKHSRGLPYGPSASAPGPPRPNRLGGARTRRSISPPQPSELDLIREDDSDYSFPDFAARTSRENSSEHASHHGEQRAGKRVDRPAGKETGDYAPSNVGRNIIKLGTQTDSVEGAVQRIEFSVPPGFTRMAMSFQFIRS